MFAYCYVALASLAITGTMASFATLKPGHYAVDDDIHVDFGNTGQIDIFSDNWELHGEEDDDVSEWAIKVELTNDWTFSTLISTVDFKVGGQRDSTTAGADLFLGFGDGSKYVTFMVDFDGGVSNTGGQSGIQIYPDCGGSLASGDIASVLNGASSLDDQAHKQLRLALAGGDVNNWDQMGGSRHDNGDTWPVTIEIENDIVDGEARVRFVSVTQSLECVYSDNFGTDSPLVFGINPDASPANGATRDKFNLNEITLAKSEVDVCGQHCDASAHSEYAPRMDYDGYRPEQESWTVELSGKDMLIVALCVVNVVVLMAVICSCSRFGAVGPQKKKYQRVSVNGDSEMEQFQN